MFKKPDRLVTKVFLHHSATDNPEHDTINFIRDVHVKQNGWKDVGYHYFIDKNGVTFFGRPLEQIPAAQRGFNTGSIAICLSGRREFTQEQRDALVRLCTKINKEYNRITFHGHKEVAATLCPAYPYKDWLHLDESGLMAPYFTKPKSSTVWERIKHWWYHLGE